MRAYVKGRKVVAIAGLAAAVIFGVGAVDAATLDLSYSNVSGSINGAGTITLPTIPGSYGYTRTFAGPTSQIPSTAYGFYDDYIFTIPAGAANSITTTINLDSLLGISNLQERLFSATANTDLSGTPTLTAPVGGAIDAWTVPVGTSGLVAVLPSTTLNPGTYVLQIRGNVTGTAGGTYSGVLNLTPVPLPAALPLLLGGFGLLGGAIRRVKKS